MSSSEVVSKTEFQLLQSYYTQEKIDHVDLQLKHRKLIEEYNKLVIQVSQQQQQKPTTTTSVVATNKTGQKKKTKKVVPIATSGEN